MSKIRVIWRSVAVLVTTFVHFSLILPFFLLKPFGFNVRCMATYLRHRWGKSVSAIMNMKVKVKGDAPQPPFFLVSNHLSYSDIWVLFSELRGTFIAKSDIKNWPVLGWMIATSGILFIDRSRRMDVKRANDEISRSIADTQGLILFPEGTTSPGDDVLPFRSPLLQYPALKNMPVHTVAIHYRSSDPAYSAREYICWWDDTPFLTHMLRLMRLKATEVVLNFTDEPVLDGDRKRLAKKAEQSVRGLYLKQKAEELETH